MEFPQKTDAVISLIGMYLKKKEALIQKDTCFPMFILFIINDIWKKLKYPSTYKWTKQIHSNGVLIIKKWRFPFTTTSMNLEGIILSEISQSNTNTICYYLRETSEI